MSVLKIKSGSAWVGVTTIRGEKGDPGGLTDEVKQTLLNCIYHQGFDDESGQAYYQALYDALFPPADLAAIEATFTQGGHVVYDIDNLDTLKQYLVVTAVFADMTTETVPANAYYLSGTLAVGTSTITVSYKGKTATFSVTVTKRVASISAVFTQGEHEILDTDTLDILPQYLVVTATNTDSTTEVISSSKYTLRGNLTAGTSTITAVYGGETDTFDVTVTHVVPQYISSGLVMHLDGINNTGEGHDNTASTWVDLMGNYSMPVGTVGTNTTWAEDGLVFAGNQNRTVKYPTTDIPNANDATIEIVVAPSNATAEEILVGFEVYQSGVSSRQFRFTDRNTVAFVGQDAPFYTNPESDYTKVRTLTCVYTSGASVYKAYINGSEASVSEKSHYSRARRTPANILFGNQYDNNANYVYHGKILSVRYYNKQLTPEEVAQNHAADVERFSLVI